MMFLSLFCGLLAGPAAQAQDFDDLDSSSGKERDRATPEVKEIVKGTYAKANVGGAIYLLDFSGWVNPGTAIALAVGQDFVDQEKLSAAWEVAFFQGVHNGKHFETQADAGCQFAGGAAPCVQGDLRTYSIVATVEASTYLNRRIGVGGRAGGGVLFSPLLMDETFYNEEVLPEFGGDPGYHGPPHPIVMGGPTFEYYTKLSHFSVGCDVDVFYAINFDLGVDITGALKYTF